MIPDYLEPLTAYRCWNAYPNGLLVGQAYLAPWPPYQPMVATCCYATTRAHLHKGALVPAPLFSCDCGLHALKSYQHALARIVEEDIQTYRYGHFNFPNEGPPTGRVWGTVKIWGRIVEHEVGYRAEYAYPSALCCEHAGLAAIVATLYGVPCEVVALDRPPVPVDEGTGSWRMTSWITFNGMPVVAQGPAVTPLPSLIQTPSLAQIKGISRITGASTWQQRQAAPKRVPDWRTVLAKAFHVKKDPTT